MRRFFPYFLLIYPFILCSQSTMSTDFSYLFGKPYMATNAADKEYFYKGDNILAVKTQKNQVVLQKMNIQSLSLARTRYYNDFPPEIAVEGVFEFGQRYYFFYSLAYDMGDQLFVREIDFEKGEFATKAKLLFQTERKVIGKDAGVAVYGIKSGMTDRFSFLFPHHRSNLMVQYRLKPEKRSDKINYDQIGFYAYDSTMQPIWNKVVTMPYTEKEMNNLYYATDDNANAYILAGVQGNVLSNGAILPYHLELLKIMAGTAKLTTSTIKTGEKNVGRIWMGETADGKLSCGGFYTKTRKLNNADGVIFFKLDEKGALYDLVTHEIPMSVIAMYNDPIVTGDMRQHSSQTVNYELPNLYIRHLIHQEDSSTLLIAEEYKVSTRTQTYYGIPINTVTTKYYNNILVTKINADGSLAWMKKIPKQQYGVENGYYNSYDKGGLSFKYMHTKGQHYFVFLDNKKNLSLVPNKKPARHRDGQGGFLTAVKLDDGTGQLSKMSIFDTRKVQNTRVTKFNTDRILSLDDRDFIVEMTNKTQQDLLIKVSIVK